MSDGTVSRRLIALAALMASGQACGSATESTSPPQGQMTPALAAERDVAENDATVRASGPLICFSDKSCTKKVASLNSAHNCRRKYTGKSWICTGRSRKPPVPANTCIKTSTNSSTECF